MVATIGTHEVLERARAAYARRDWRQALELLSRSDREAPLAVEDVWRLAWAADLTGQLDETFRAFERAHQMHLDAGDCPRASRAGFWIGMRLMSIGEHARGSGWFAKAQRIVEREGASCAEAGLLLLPVALRHVIAGDNELGREIACRAGDLGERFADPDLIALARRIEGKAVLRQGDIIRGFALLDEAMVAVTSPAISPSVPGIVYCDVIVCCHQFFVVDRARQYTAVLSAWCDAQPELRNFTGTCLVHRAELMQLGGDWPKAIEEARRAGERLSREIDPLALAGSHYQQAEIHRLRGNLDAAEADYRIASELGGDSQPGLALLRVAQGRSDVAAKTIQRVLDTTTTPWRRAKSLPAYVEIMLAAGDLDAARRAANELRETADRYGIEVLDAIAAHARGAVLLEGGDARHAIEPLRHAFAIWQKNGAPYNAARIRVLIGRACRDLGDSETADLELAAARRIFERVGAAPDLELVTTTVEPDRSRGDHGLTERELEVLQLVARGDSNKQIARTLSVSERTIDRHVSNIFGKLDVHSRAAATAFAYAHRLVGGDADRG